MKIDKTMCQFWHAKKRAKERLGITLTREKYEQIISAIRDLRIENTPKNKDIKAEFIEIQSKRVRLFKITLSGLQPFNVVYDCNRKTIVTFLFPEDDTKYIYHYIDIFGNKINLKNECGEIWKFIDNDLKANFTTFRKIKENVWYNDDYNKKFEYKDDVLMECFETY